MRKWAIGVDLGGTKIEAAIINAKGRLLDRLRMPTNTSKGPDEIVQQIVDAITTLCGHHSDITPSAVGIGVAGQIDNETGSVIYAPNLEWHNVPLQQKLADKLHLPVFVCNDVKAATYGEWKYGAGIACNNMICIFIGTGIGSGIVYNGKMLNGCNNTAGEIGHMTLDMHGPLCHCGNTGCFEALAGGWAIARDAKAAVLKDKAAGKVLLELAGGDINAITAETVSKAAQQRDPLACALIENVVDVLIAGTTSVVNMLNPCRLVFGGGIIEGMPALIGRIEEGVKKYALKTAVDTLEVLPAKLHNDSGVVGAAAFAMHLFEKVKP